MKTRFSLILALIFGYLLFAANLSHSEDYIEGLLDARLRAQETSAKATLSTIASACEMYAVDNGNYPSSIDQLMKGNPPYLSQKAYVEGVNGYKFKLESKTDGCRITATPLECGKTGNKILIKESMKEISQQACR
ncbi:MAG: type II secretion system protein GspG [Candidatus Omnitrophica bacterium]|nr:type II secretion system protein GspG [Candidatus Omnitrophota bacterium]